MTPERRNIPEWARQERQQDLAWIGEYFEAFWLAASLSYESVGRGAIVVDTTVQVRGAGHPFAYAPQADIDAGEDEDAKRMVRTYDPGREVVIMLWKEGRTSTYRFGLQKKGSQA